MKPSTLLAIKNSVKPLISLLEAYKKTKGIKEDLLTAILVELHNFCHGWDHCQGYTFEEDLERCQAIYDFLIELKKYESDFHFVCYIVDEFTMTYDSNLMSEDEEAPY